MESITNLSLANVLTEHVPDRRVDEVILGFNKQQLKISTRDRMSTDRVAVGVGIQVDEINTGFEC